MQGCVGKLRSPNVGPGAFPIGERSKALPVQLQVAIRSSLRCRTGPMGQSHHWGHEESQPNPPER